MRSRVMVGFEFITGFAVIVGPEMVFVFIGPDIVFVLLFVILIALALAIASCSSRMVMCGRRPIRRR
ncbi:hypothetical protein NY2A_b032L [Paramecium bursaria Chlorella virus NY2A]|uniref:Uncharacterized protein b032L n=1 Tax=Paramecium bursaria Chlorella virus NY2A TaxID=46021 RepID=A7IVQ7_PBCVN|nr:hypothetical protein NY2A_b032L [Paramecium bursaria Chlorella virus NY2A]YP_001498112.1 hypothetical protein AR158_c030L [Paramecium bursaria Chlorella virus AR158]ABT14431.1 hypothetical protein NY2A_b032L [Paramecium bursaria Chlorella virus NY2A]ABU43576.1 hypothetical protein AR158_c030L [Paramecium bursaria Chlorella virus AR158]